MSLSVVSHFSKMQKSHQFETRNSQNKEASLGKTKACKDFNIM